MCRADYGRRERNSLGIKNAHEAPGSYVVALQKGEKENKNTSSARIKPQPWPQRYAQATKGPGTFAHVLTLAAGHCRCCSATFLYASRTMDALAHRPVPLFEFCNNTGAVLIPLPYSLHVQFSLSLSTRPLCFVLDLNKAEAFLAFQRRCDWGTREMGCACFTLLFFANRHRLYRLHLTRTSRECNLEAHQPAPTNPRNKHPHTLLCQSVSMKWEKFPSVGPKFSSLTRASHRQILAPTVGIGFGANAKVQ